MLPIFGVKNMNFVGFWESNIPSPCFVRLTTNFEHTFNELCFSTYQIGFGVIHLDFVYKFCILLDFWHFYNLVLLFYVLSLTLALMVKAEDGETFNYA